ncbi:MAG: DUF4838 domain-containing protein [Clostridia bacterium]|nr:DUF4838 domain-containing protein [Clostridia bacterium]
MKKIVKGILLVPIILIAIVLIAVFAVFIISSYKVEYGADEYQISPADYADLERFTVNGGYKLLVTDSDNLPIAEKFNGYIEKIIGKKLDVVTGKNGSPYIELTVKPGLKDDCVFSGDNRNITICADNKDHLLRGAYAFLEEFGGVRCYTSKMITFTSDNIFFPKKEGGYTKAYNGYFEMLDTDWISPKDDEYSWFRGFNTDEYRYEVKNQDASAETAAQAEKRITAENEYYLSLGGRSQYISGFAHTFTSDFLNKEKYYDNGLELECYALDSKGNRRRDELCLSNPRTLEIVTQEVFDILENNRADTDRVLSARYDRNAPLQIISLTQSDDLTGCKCSECVKCAREHGGYSAPNLIFVNKVAQAVKDAGYDNVAIDTFAYRYTRPAPTDIVPLDNVIIRLCSIECCCSHYIDDDKCLANKAFMKDLADWSNICNRIYIWDYCTDFSYFATVFPNLNVLAHNIRVFSEHNVKGLYEEGNYTLNKDGYDPEFAELRAYLISKVMQNPYCDYNAVIKDFCNAYYGEAGGDIFNFITLADKFAGRTHLNIYKNPRNVLSLSKSEIKQLDGYFEHAKETATGEALENVKRSEISWRYVKMYKKVLEFSKKSSFEVNREKLLTDFAATGNSRLHEVESNYKLAGLGQNAIIDLRPLFDLVVGNFIYGP